MSLETVAIDKKRPSLMIATPMYGGMCTGQFMVGVLQTINKMQSVGVQVYFVQMGNESLITRARNELTRIFLEKDFDYLMFIDADIGFNPTDILSMINANKDIICGIYPKKEIDWVQVSNAVKDGVPPQELSKYTGAFVVNLVHDAKSAQGAMNEPIQIANGGTGFMLIKREVLEKLKDVVPTYNSDMYMIVDTERKPRKIYQYFDVSIDRTDNDRLLSEDYHFCKLARDNGFKVWAAPWAQLSHTGSYTFSGFLPRA